MAVVLNQSSVLPVHHLLKTFSICVQKMQGSGCIFSPFCVNGNSKSYFPFRGRYEERCCRRKQLPREFNVGYVTLYLAYVFPSPNLIVCSFFRIHQESPQTQT